MNVSDEQQKSMPISQPNTDEDRTMPTDATQPTDDPDAPTDDELTGPFPRTTAGPADLTLDIDQDTFDTLRVAYWRAKRAGYQDTFALFVFNNTRIAAETVTVDGEPVNPEIDDWLELNEEDREDA